MKCGCYRKHLVYIRDEVSHKPKPDVLPENYEQYIREWIWRIHDRVKGALREHNWDVQNLLSAYNLFWYLPGAKPDDVNFEKLHEVEQYVTSFLTSLSQAEYSIPRKLDVAVLLDLYILTYNMLKSYPENITPTSYVELNRLVELLSETDDVVCKDDDLPAGDLSRDIPERKKHFSECGKKHCIEDELGPMIRAELTKNEVKTARDCWSSFKRNYSETRPYCALKYKFYMEGDRLVYEWDSSRGKKEKSSMGFSSFKNKVSSAKKV